MGGEKNMTYVINPWFFYWMQVSDTVREVLGILACLVGVAMAIAAAVKMCCWFGEESEDLKRATDRALKTSVILFVPLLLLYSFLPSRDTLLSMQVASLTTAENAEMALAAVQSAVDYIIEAIGRLG